MSTIILLSSIMLLAWISARLIARFLSFRRLPDEFTRREKPITLDNTTIALFFERERERGKDA
jgi:hypothetical protein